MANSNNTKLLTSVLEYVACTPSGQMGLLELTMTGAFRKLQLSTTRSFHEASQFLIPSLNPVLPSIADEGARATLQGAKGATTFRLELLALEHSVISRVCKRHKMAAKAQPCP